MIPDPIQQWLSDNGYGRVVASRPVGGGCISNGAVIETARGQTFFLKTNPNAPEDMFAREAEGLAALRVPDGPQVPRPFLHGQDFLLLEDLNPSSRRPDYWTAFGQELASLHSHTHSAFGFYHDNYIGSTPQVNPWTEDGYVFFAEHRLLFQARLAQRRGLLGSAEVQQVERLASLLPELVPAQPASLLHGDLWSGNALADGLGRPALIDPAVYYGWAEAELAMTALFGAFPESFYQAYHQARPLDKGYESRFPIYNLYHLLNHLNLFGEGYLGQVVGIIRRYGR